MSDSDKHFKQYEVWVISQLNEGRKLREITVSQIQEAVGCTRYVLCATWFDSFKQRLGLDETPPQPEWFNAWAEQLQVFTRGMWPRIHETLHAEMLKVRNEAEAKLEDAESKYTDAMNTITRLESDNEIQAAELETTKQLLAQAMGMVNGGADQDESEALSQEGTMQPAIDALVYAHQQTVSALNGQLTEVTQQRDNLKVERDNLVVERDGLVAERDELAHKVSDLTGELEAEQGKVQAANSARDAATQKASGIEQQLTEAKQQVKTLECQVKELKASQSPDAKKLDKLTAKVEEQKAEIKDLITRIKMHENRNEMLVQQNASQAQQLEKSNTRLFAASEAQFKAEAEAEVLRGKLEALGSQGTVEKPNKGGKAEGKHAKDQNRKSSAKMPKTGEVANEPTTDVAQEKPAEPKAVQKLGHDDGSETQPDADTKES